MSSPIAGPCCPTWEVVKNRGSNPLKSFSAVIRLIRTEPTMPRQPMNPTRTMGDHPFMLYFYRPGEPLRPPLIEKWKIPCARNLAVHICSCFTYREKDHKSMGSPEV